MAIRIDTAFQAIYVWEAEGHTVPALNTALSAGGLMRVEGPTTDESLVCGFYGVSTGTLNYWALIKNAGSNNVELRGYNGSLVTSGTYALSPGQYHISIEHDSGTVRARLDGVVILSMAFSPLAGTAGDRSFQIGGYGEEAGIIDCTVERWRMWSGLLTEAQWRDEFRSEVPVRTVGLVHDWPMVAGSGRLNDTVEGEPDLSENEDFPVGDGTAITLLPSLYGTPQFFALGDSATPGAQTITVPQFAKAVAIHIFATDDTVPDVDVTSVTSNFTGSFTLDNITASATSAGGAIATALVQSYGSNRSFTIVMDAANGLAGAGAWVSFLQDVPDSFVTDTDHGEASGDGTTPGVASASGVDGGLAIASDTRLDAGSGNYPANQSGWTSLATGQSGPGGTIGYYGPSRLRQKAITATGTETATTQTTFASIVSLLTLAPSPALATVAPTAPVVESGDCTNSGNNTASTSWAVSHPAAVAGDMLIFNLAWDDSTTVSSVTAPAGPNGETAVSIAGPVASASTEVRAQAWRYIATGSWSAGTRTFTPSASEQWTATVLKVPAGEFDDTTPIGAASTRASAGTAESSALSPAYSLGSSDGGGRLVAWLAADDDPFDAQASGWTQLANVDRGVVAGCLAARDLQTSDSESVAAGTWRIASDSWASLAYVIRKPASGSTTYTLATSLAMAVQLARSASASVAVPVQDGKTAGTAVAMALQESHTAQSQIAAAVSQARAASMVLALGVQAAAEAGFSAGLAVQQAMAAAATLDMAVSRAESASASVALQVQAAAEASASVDLMVQSGASQSVSAAVLVQELKQAVQDVALAVQQAQTAAMSLTAAVQTQRDAGLSIGLAALLARSAGVSVDLQVQDGASVALAVQAAVQFARQASASLSAAVAALVTAGTSVRAAVSLQNTLGAAMTAAISARATSGVSASLYVLTDEPDELFPLAGQTQTFELTGQSQGFPLGGQVQTFPLG